MYFCRTGSSSIPFDRASDYLVAVILEWPAAAAHGWLSGRDLSFLSQ